MGQDVHDITTSLQHEGFWPKVGIERQSCFPTCRILMKCLMPGWAVYSQGNQVILHHPRLLPFKKGEDLTKVLFLL